VQQRCFHFQSQIVAAGDFVQVAAAAVVGFAAGFGGGSDSTSFVDRCYSCDASGFAAAGGPVELECDWGFD